MGGKSLFRPEFPPALNSLPTVKWAWHERIIALKRKYYSPLVYCSPTLGFDERESEGTLYALAFKRCHLFLRGGNV